MNNLTDTPRTDAAIAPDLMPCAVAARHVKLTRDLERENARLRAALRDAAGQECEALNTRKIFEDNCFSCIARAALAEGA